jgi:hypothetical protein
VETGRLEPGSGTLHDLSPAWRDALAEAQAALAAGRTVAAVGEPGAGRVTLLSQAHRAVAPRDRILCASTPLPRDLGPWLALWTPEVGKPHTAVVVGDVGGLPLAAAERLRHIAVAARAARRAEGGELPFAMTAERFEDIPAPLAGLVDTVVTVPPLRERPDDVLPLARHVARRARGRDVELTPAAAHALRDHAWPGNVDQLAAVVRAAAARTDLVDVRHLPPTVLSGSQHRLSRIETFERDEIVRVLTTPGMTMKDAAGELGMSRATIYRKVTQYDIHIPKS